MGARKKLRNIIEWNRFKEYRLIAIVLAVSGLAYGVLVPGPRRAQIAEQVQEEHTALVNELSEIEKRTQPIVIMMYVGAGALVVVVLVVGLLYMRQKRQQLGSPRRIIPVLLGQVEIN